MTGRFIDSHPVRGREPKHCDTGELDILLYLRHASGLGPVGSVDLCVDGQIVVAQGENSVMGLGKDRGRGKGSSASWPVEHLGLELAELVLEVGVLVGQGLDDAGVPVPDPGLLGGPKVLGSLES